MSPIRSKVRVGVCGVLEGIARMVLGERAAIVPATRLRQLEQLEYREILRAAELRGDVEFLQREIEKNQLTQEDLRRLRKKLRPVGDWPDTDESIFAAGEGTAGRVPWRSAGR
jgi:hypothetical protein